MRTFLTIIITTFTLICYSQKVYVDSSLYDNGRLESKGLRYRGTNGDYEVGLWQYWYEDGKKQLEILGDTVKSLYVNMWSGDGTQILRNGQGYYYSIEPQGDPNDSLVYQITNSIKHGEFKRYRSWHGKPYSLVETGQYDHEKQTGQWVFEDTVLKFKRIQHFVDDEENGTRQTFYPTGQLKDSVRYVGGKPGGKYKLYSEEGTLLMACSYLGGNLIDKYEEYYLNGKPKVSGEYAQGKGYIRARIRSVGGDLKTKDRIEYRLIPNKALKHGTWTYYNPQGKVIKKENYVRGKKV